MYAWRSLLILTFSASSVAAQCPPEQLFLSAQRMNATASHLVAADFNADGRTDFAACSGLISTLDFNHDGIADLSANGVVDVYLANGVDTHGEVTFSPPAHYSGGLLLGQGVGVGDGSFVPGSAPSTTDFSGDGIYDLVSSFGPFCNSYPNDCPIGISVRHRRLAGFDDKVLSLYARGMTTREIQGHLKELYGTEISPTLISAVTDAVLEDVQAWQSRPLDPMYPIVYLDAIHLKLRVDGKVETRAVYLALGLSVEGRKDLLGLWLGDNEDAKFWMMVLTELKTGACRTSWWRAWMA